MRIRMVAGVTSTHSSSRQNSRACSSDSCQGYKDSFGENSTEYQQCRSQARSSGGYYGSSSGGSYGGYSSGGGGHK